MNDIETLVFTRKGEVEALILKHRAEIASLESELERIDEIISTQGFTRPVAARASSSPGSSGRATPKPAIKKKEPTIKEKIIAVLAESPEGLRMKDLHAAIERKFGAEVLEKSVVPQVSRLRDDRKIYKSPEGLWRLPDTLFEEEHSDEPEHEAVA